MKRSVSALAVTTMLAGALALGACSKKAQVADELPPQPATVADNGPPPGPGPVDTVIPGSNADFLAQMNGRNVIYFDTDKYDIDATDAAALRTQAEWLRRYPTKRATIEGHCDERGTAEYNQALGERRAQAARDYLVAAGIAADRMSIISYGKERPFESGHDESAWQQNRRAQFVMR